MTNLDRLAEIIANMTPGPWRYAQLLDGIEARALIDGKGYHFGQSDDLENGHGIVALRNCAEELIAVARAARDFRALKASEAYNRQGESKGRRDALDDALAALDAKLAEQSPT